MYYRIHETVLSVHGERFRTRRKKGVGLKTLPTTVQKPKGESLREDERSRVFHPHFVISLTTHRLTRTENLNLRPVKLKKQKDLVIQLKEDPIKIEVKSVSLNTQPVPPPYTLFFSRSQFLSILMNRSVSPSVFLKTVQKIHPDTKLSISSIFPQNVKSYSHRTSK